MSKYINIDNVKKSFQYFKNAKPFSHCVIDNFFLEDVAIELEREFPSYNDEIWQEYNNPLEVKKLTNNWNHFKPLTYKVLCEMNSNIFCNLISELSDIFPLYSDDGLNGGGWHIHKSGGKLNPHLDYSIHPKLGLQRKLNIIIYLNSSWKDSWGGHLGFWDQDDKNKEPKNLVKTIKPDFNKAIIFDTSQNSWHGMINEVKSPEAQERKSLAIYYLSTPAEKTEKRGKALFAPTADQKGDREIEELIKKRASVKGAKSVYKA